MAGRYTGPVRFQEITADNAQNVQIEGRRMLGVLMEQLSLGGITIGKLTRQLDDGTIIVAWFDGTLAQVRAYPAKSASSTQADFDLWIPRGFILYPASDTSANGWGAPVAQNTDAGATPYSPVNLAPGLDVSRWTANGRLGEILLTQVPGAGYPKAGKIIPPLLFDNTYGLKPSASFKISTTTGPWAAYRMEFTGFAAESPSAGFFESANIVANKRALFKLVNDDRGSNDPFLMPIRGRYDTAQATSEVAFASSILAHYSVNYPPTYQTYPDRASKDGLIGFISQVNAASRNKPVDTTEEVASTGFVVHSYGVDPNGEPISGISPGAPITAQVAFDLYMAEPAHKANLESIVWNGHHTSVCYGFKGAFNALNIFPNTAWINAGNRATVSADKNVPIVSWMGFAALNLGFETWPASFNQSDTGPPSDPLTLNAFGGDGSTAFWLKYFYAYDHAYDYSVVSGPGFSLEKVPFSHPALDSRIFMRGRCVALAPRGGLVWAAAIQTFDSPDGDRFNVYRLVALVHHAADQNADQKTYGMTSALRVWYCDLPNDSPIPANPHSTIRGVYGEENEGWPWDVVDSPYSWRGGILVDVGTTDGTTRDSLKYASQWVFSSDGMKAICLRDHGTYAQYASLWTSGYLLEAPGLICRSLELTFGGNAFNPLTVASKSWRGQNAGAVPIVSPDPWETIRTVPICAGYNAANQPFYTFISYTAIEKSFVAFTTDWDFTPTEPQGIHYSSNQVDYDDPAINLVQNLQILDVKDQVFIAAGIIQVSSPTTPFLNPAFENCWLDNPTRGNCGVSVYRMGARLNHAEYANPDTMCQSLQLICQGEGLGGYTELLLSTSRWVLGSYATNGTDWVVSYIVEPQENVAWNVIDPVFDCTFSVEAACGPGPGSTLQQTSNFVVKPACRGGFVTSSIGDGTALAGLMQIPGSHPRTLYARAV